MKKKLFFVLMICVLAAVVAATLAGCRGDKLPSVRNLNVTDDGYLAWGAVEGADGYVVYFNDDESERFYITDPYISIDNPEIKSALKSGQKNNVYIRAVTLGKDNLPDKTSDRSMIIFNYSRKLATPNKIKMSKDRFSWRGVNDATDYKAYVVKSGETSGTLYDMTWSTGTASVVGTINDLPNGNMYYVSIVATAEGYESSDPSDSVPFDRTIVNVDQYTYSVKAGDATYAMAVDPDDEKSYVATVTAKAGDTFAASDNFGKAYALDVASATVDGDYVISIDTTAGSGTVKAIASYYIYVNGATTATKLSFNAGSNVYTVNVTLTNGDNFVVKDGAGNLVTTYTDASANQGSSVVAGEYAIRVIADSDVATVDVSAGKVDDIGTSTPDSKDGMWAVYFDYNYEGAPAAEVIYATDGRPVAAPASPVRTGYTFEGWYQDSVCLIEAPFGKKQSNFAITAPTTLYAKWAKDGPAVVEHTTHVDANTDGKCDVCGATVAVQCTNHVDVNSDGKCDVCGKTMPTVKCTNHKDRDGDGKCDVCGVDIEVIDVPVDTTATIYLDVSKYAWFADGGAVINVHIWYADGTNNGFPGAKMTYNATLGYYEATYYSSRTIKGVLFTRNNPNPNPAEGEVTEWNRIEVTDFTFDPTYPVYKLQTYSDVAVRGKWIKVGEEEEAKGDGKIYLDYREIDWYKEASPVNMVYIWYTDGTENEKFPGKEVTYGTLSTCYVDYFTDKTIAGIIFTRNDPAVELGQGVWNTIEMSLEAGNLAFDPAKPAYRVTAWGTTFEGYWETEAEALTDAPVIEEPEDATATAYFYIDASHISWFADNSAVIKAVITYTDTTVNNNGGVAATVENGLYKWGYNADKTIKSILIERVNPAVTGEVWNQFNVALSDNVAKDVIVLRSIEGSTASYTYSDTEGNVDESVSRTVYFTNNKSWREVWAYAWVGDGANKVENAGWPGVKLSEIDQNEQSQGIFEFTFSSQYTGVIFNGKAGPDDNIYDVQTVDIYLSDLPAGNNAYYLYDAGNDGKYWYGTWAYEPAAEPKTLQSISATYNGGTVAVGNDVDLTKIAVTASYSDGSSAPVAGFTLGDYDKTTAGTKTITVNYEDKSNTISVTYVAEAVSTRTIYFTNNYSWRGVWGYAWVGEGDDKVENAAWRGVQLEEVGTNDQNQGVYAFTFSTEFEKIIFNGYAGPDGSTYDVQTVDIVLSALDDGANAYYISGGENNSLTVGTWTYSE